jgi:hypothetical protein
MEPQTYFVHNTTRARHNRTLRSLAPEHGGHKQLIGDHRVILNRPVKFTEEEILRHLPALKQKAAYGQIEVRDAEGRKLDLDTLELSGAVMATPPLYHRRPDSIANDAPFHGHPLPQFPGGIPEVPVPGTEGVPSLVSGATEEDESDDSRSDPRPGVVVATVKAKTKNKENRR